MSDKRCFNVDPMLKMKQNPMSGFKRCTAFIQGRYPMLHNVDTVFFNIAQHRFNVISSLI